MDINVRENLLWVAESDVVMLTHIRKSLINRWILGFVFISWKICWKTSCLLKYSFPAWEERENFQNDLERMSTPCGATSTQGRWHPPDDTVSLRTLCLQPLRTPPWSSTRATRHAPRGAESLGKGRRASGEHIMETWERERRWVAHMGDRKIVSNHNVAAK